MENSIRVNRGKEIDVNDQGETISIRLGDYTLIMRLASLMQELSEAAKGIANKARECGGTDIERVTAIAEYNLARCTELKDKIDDILGPETCRKVFGDIVPGIPEMLDFMAQLVEIVRQMMEEEEAASEQRLSKYLSKYERKEA